MKFFSSLAIPFHRIMHYIFYQDKQLIDDSNAQLVLPLVISPPCVCQVLLHLRCSDLFNTNS